MPRSPELSTRLIMTAESRGICAASGHLCVLAGLDVLFLLAGRAPTDPHSGASWNAESSGHQVVRIPAGLDDIDPLRRDPSCLAYERERSHRERVERHQKRGIPRGCSRLRLARGTACEAWAIEHHRKRGCVACRLARRRAARPAWLLTRTGTRDRALSAPRIARPNDLWPRLYWAQRAELPHTPLGGRRAV